MQKADHLQIPLSCYHHCSLSTYFEQQYTSCRLAVVVTFVYLENTLRNYLGLCLSISMFKYKPGLVTGTPYSLAGKV